MKLSESRARMENKAPTSSIARAEVNVEVESEGDGMRALFISNARLAWLRRCKTR